MRRIELVCDFQRLINRFQQMAVLGSSDFLRSAWRDLTVLRLRQRSKAFKSRILSDSSQILLSHNRDKQPES
jgi:hypothetical protein